jgi:hypothetical protein
MKFDFQLDVWEDGNEKCAPETLTDVSQKVFRGVAYPSFIYFIFFR